MIRLGVVGYGLRTHGVINDALRSVEPDVKIVGIVDPNEAEVKKRLLESDRADVVFYKNLKEMVTKANLDGLLIGTRCNLHTPYAIEAAKYDIPLYLEKPVAISMKQAMALERAYENSKSQVLVSFPLRVSPMCLHVKDLVSDGAVGSCEHINAVNYVPYGRNYWEEPYRNYDITQGLFLQKATHDLDYMMYLMGSPIVRVGSMKTAGRIFGGKKRAGLRCSKCKQNGKCLESPEYRKRNYTGGDTKDHPCPFSVDCGSPETGMNEDSSSVLVEFESGVHGIYTQVFFVRFYQARGATITGYDGTVKFDWYENEYKHIMHHKPFENTGKVNSEMGHFGGDVELAYDFINMIKGKGSPRCTIQDGLRSVYVCLAAKESAEKGQFTEVRQV